MNEPEAPQQPADSASVAPAVVHGEPVAPQAFISYASADNAIANTVCHALERAGVKCWIAPRDVTPGELYAGNIVHAIDTTRVVVLVLSQHAVESAHVLREVERASSKRHPIVSFRIDMTPLPDDFAYFLNTSQWLDASATGVDRSLPRLVDAVRTALGKRTDTARVNQPTPVTVRSNWRPRQMFVALAVIIAAALAFFVVDRFWLSKPVDAEKPSVEVTAAAPTDPSETPTIPTKSIAVLPFADMSAEKNQEYMSDGIAEELINLLVQVPDLKVIARTSSFAFEGQNIEVSEIAKKLNVAHVLEGSVRKSGNKLRITAQLVRTSDSTQLWSQTYDRPLDDIFAVQDEIANAIVQALQIKLKGGSLSRQEGGTQNFQAYQLYLRAVSATNQNTKASLDTAEGYAEQAIKLDQSYGRAWIALAWIVINQADNGYLPAKEGYERGRQLALHALQLSSELAEAHAALAYIYQPLEWNWAASEVELQRALAIDPTDPSALQSAGVLATTLGHWDDAERHFRTALVRDPLNPFTIYNLGIAYYLAGRFAEAEGEFGEVLEREPGFVWTRRWLGKTLLAQGKPEAALAMVQQEVDEANRLAILPVVLHAVGRRAEADEALNELIARWGDTWPVSVGHAYAYRGDHDQALEWLERAYKQHDVSLTTIVGEPLFKSMVNDPRYKAFLRKMKLPET